MSRVLKLSHSEARRLGLLRAVRPPERASFTGVTVVVPLEHCASDNGRYIVMRGQRRLVLAPEYRRCKEVVRRIAFDAMRGQLPAECPVEVLADVHFANNRRDLLNSAKMLLDALSGVCYVDDKQIVRARWTRGPNDPAHPHVRLTISPAEHPYP